MPDQTLPTPTTASEEEVATRESRVASAVGLWTDQLSTLGGHDALHRYRDLPLGTLDLTHAHPSGLAMLFAGRPTRLTDLVREPGALADARRRARAVSAKAAELADERGLAACWLAVGIATWTVPEGPPPAAPVLLRSCVLRPRGPAAEDFDVDLGDDVELNPALVHDLRELGVRLDGEAVARLALTDVRFDPAPALGHVAAACLQVPGFRAEQRLVVGTYSAAASALRADLAAQGESLAGHAVVAALAGDPTALAGHAAELPPSELDADPRRELVVLDADRDQQRVIDAVRAGSHLVVQAPPGTGRSQTIAGLVAALAADGRRTLLVAQKRAAIDDVLARLAEVGLDDLVLHLPEGGSGRRRVVRTIAARLDRSEGAARPEDDRLVSVLEERRAALSGHVEALHAHRAPWGVSAYDAQIALAELTVRRPAPRSRVRVHGEALTRLSRPALDGLAEQLRAAATAGVLDVGPDRDPWFAADLQTAQEAEQALRTVNELVGTTLPRARQRVSALLEDAGLPAGRTLADWGESLALVASVRQTLEVFSTAVWDTSLADAVAATATPEWRVDRGIELDWWERRRVVRQARSLLRPGPPPQDLHAALALVHDQRERWQQLAGRGARPRVPAGVASAQQAHAEVVRSLGWLGERLAGSPGGGDLLVADLEELTARLTALQEGSATLTVAPRAAQLRRRLHEAGLEPLLADLATRSVAAHDVDAELQLVWWTSLLQHVAAVDPRYGKHDGELLRTQALEYAAADREHVAAGASRVRRTTAERVAQAVQRHPEQADLLRAEGDRVRGHRPLLDLARSCPDVLAAATPCLAVSPLVVPDVLAPETQFDVVVVDEASSLLPAEAVSALSRGRQVVVVGDEKLLPPAPWTVAADPEGAEPSGSAAPESLLDALSPLLPVARLRTEHRAQDETLVAFANEQVYAGGLLTVPAGGESTDGPGGRVRLEVVEGTGAVAPGADAVESTDAEVARVVELVLEHARTRPHESLGVVTLGRRHADEIREAVRLALAQAPELAGSLEALLVKAVDDAQGDTRDAVLLSVGFGRTPHGRVLHRFGPLAEPGGERRLAVAVTRARRRMTVVASFGPDDLDPERLSARGPRLLRELLAYAAAGGRSGRGSDPVFDPLLSDLAERLRAERLQVVERYGLSGVPVDLAVGEDGGPLLVAVEADGPAYAATASTRDRDRLRVQHLERLGWTHLRLWSTDVFRDPAREVARVVAVVRAAAGRDRRRRAGVVLPVDGGFQHVRWDLDRAPVRPSAQPAVQSGPRPAVRPGLRVEDYTDAELDAVVRWIRADTLSRTDEQVAALARQLLGFRRRSARVDAALDGAIVRVADGRRLAGESS